MRRVLSGLVVVAVLGGCAAEQQVRDVPDVEDTPTVEAPDTPATEVERPDGEDPCDVDADDPASEDLPDECRVDDALEPDADELEDGYSR